MFSLHFPDLQYMPPCTPAMPIHSSFPNVQLSVFRKPPLAFPVRARWMPLFRSSPSVHMLLALLVACFWIPTPSWLTLISLHDSVYHPFTKILTAILVPRSELTDPLLCSYGINSISLHSNYNTQSLFLKICLTPLRC